jgi:molybdopterin synthase catalytic subunit
VILADIRDEPLSVDECVAFVSGPGFGGIAVFVGTVRDTDHGRDVTSLDYSAHPSALATLEAVAGGVAAEFPGGALAAVHRVGSLRVGDLAVVVAASAEHRAEAFAAARALIDRLKHEVPIWKRQVFADGEVEWVGCS